MVFRDHLPDPWCPAMLLLGEHKASKAMYKVMMALTEMGSACRIAHAFRGYKKDADWEVTRWESNYLRLTQRHK